MAKYVLDKNIRDWKPGDALQGFYIMKSCAVKTGSNGSTFLAATLSDASGDAEAKLWNYTGDFGSKDEGTVVKVRGTVQEYKGANQLSIDLLRRVGEEDVVDIERLVPHAPIDEKMYMSEIQSYVDTLEDPDYRKVCHEMLIRHQADLMTIPAAKSVHHGFVGGLLMHTGNMLRIADILAANYANVVDRSLLLAGTLLHDFAKAKEYEISQLGLVSAYSVPGQLLGHLVMGAMEVDQVARELGIPEEKAMLLEHMLLSHHGEPNFGAAVVPQCIEAELLHLVDMIDSRVEIYRENLEDVPVGEFTQQKVFALGKRIYRH